MPLKSGVTAPELSTLGERELRERVLSRPLPRHVAIIMDGNGRWATSRGLPRVAGHGEGVKSVRSVVRAAGDALLSPSVTRRLIEAFATTAGDAPVAVDLDLLTNREREVMTLVAGGLR